jgi:hypothetical protein
MYITLYTASAYCQHYSYYYYSLIMDLNIDRIDSKSTCPIQHIFNCRMVENGKGYWAQIASGTAFPFCLSENGLGRIRTCDQPVMSRPLCHWATSPHFYPWKVSPFMATNFVLLGKRDSNPRYLKLKIVVMPEPPVSASLNVISDRGLPLFYH